MIADTIKCYKTYWLNGNCKCEEYYYLDCRHHTDDPAYKIWYENGKLQSQSYFNYGKLHKIDGPAYQYWNRDGSLKHEEYWLEAIQHYTFDDLQYALKLSCLK